MRVFFDNRYEYLAFENPLHFDREKFIGRSLSSSYSLGKGNKKYDAYMEELKAVFDKYFKHGILTMENQTGAYIGTI